MLSSRIAAFAVATACVTLCAASQRAGHAAVSAVRYPLRTVTCGTVDGAPDLRWRDFEVLQARAKALGSTPVTATYLYFVNITGTATSTVDDLRAPSLSVSASGSVSRMQQICTGGAGRLSVPVELRDAVTSFGPQPTPTGSRVGNAVEPAAVRAFIAGHYRVHHLTCTAGMDARGRPLTAASTTIWCGSQERTFFVDVLHGGAEFRVTPVPH